MDTSDHTTSPIACTKCKAEYPPTTENFRAWKGRLFPICRKCEREYARQYRVEHRDKQLLAQKKYRETHREEIRAAYRAWYEDNRESQIKRNVIYRKANPDGYRTANRRRYALKKGSGGTHTSADIRILVRSQTDKHGRLHCWWCEKVINDKNYHVDHRIPLARGGSDAPNNLCVSCPKCNHAKYDKLPQEWNGRLL